MLKTLYIHMLIWYYKSSHLDGDFLFVDFIEKLVIK